MSKEVDINASSAHARASKLGGTFSMGGNTPLHYAAFTGHSDVARVLLENRADVKARNENGDAALDVAKEYMNVKIAKMLEKPDEAVAKARQEMKETLAAEAARREAAERERVKQSRRKESRHRRAVEAEAERVAELKREAAEELREQSRELIPHSEAHRYEPLAHYPK